MNRTVIKCGNLSVRSTKAKERLDVFLKNSWSSAVTGRIVYKIKGIGTKDIEIWQNNDFQLTESEAAPEILINDRSFSPVFFDQTQYTFSIHIPEAENAWLFSTIASLCDSTDWDTDTKRLTIPVNFGNDLGDFELCWEWDTDEGERHSASFSGQVFSTKLDIYSHFKTMLTEVQNKFEWIELDLLRQTAWGWSHSGESDISIRSWLLIFQNVRNKMDFLFHKLIDQHRKRLVTRTRFIRADKIRKLSHKMEEKVAEGISVNPEKKYSIPEMVLNADTPENRYMKYILFQTVSQLKNIVTKIEPVSRISDVFKERMHEWYESWKILKQHRFWRSIKDFNGLRKESKILTQDPVYAGITHSWFLLNQGLELFNKDLAGGIQNAAQLYEVWCLVKLDEIIRDLGWKYQSESEADYEIPSDEIDIDSEEITAGSMKIVYKKNDLINIEMSLLFQPVADKIPDKKGIWDGMTSVPVKQKPDIVLRLHRNDLPGEPVYTWIFDAKYRLNGNNAPDDAVNQMHRYRDAILWAGETAGGSQLTRESIGAFVLYPGEFNEYSPQIESIKKVNIGAFPLKPEAESTKSQLKDKIETLLDIKTDFKGVKEKEAEYYSSVPKVKQELKEIYAQCITKSQEGMNTAEYWDKCRYYRLPVRQAEKASLAPEEWTYILPESRDGEILGKFPILKTETLSRIEIKKLYDNARVNMYNKSGAENDIYWLFTLGDPLDNMPDLDNINKRKVVKISEFEE